MNWFFWKRNNCKEADTRIEQLDENLQQIKDMILAVGNTVNDCLLQQEESGKQLTRLTRLQYKSGQETQSKLEQVAQGLLAAQQWQDKCGELEAQASVWNRQRQYALDVLITQLDDLDSACAGFKGAESNDWQPLFAGWAHRIVTALAEMGIYEIEVIGKVFDPQIAEGLGTVLRPPAVEAAIPYEVAEVVKRGFINSEGQLLRKAQVITYLEGIGSND
ncbi:nucleotide exchange factor GrpE [Sporomusa acidovorans]|uniref:Protein GrpE n=1 Tax=Sporomusa acidovorans (strain ATCC 49682 / DSM 3132 / Mol) TaxID=1123286 RepID=A0ABZ3IYL0_SPOA4|nr:nucleotide exchange factor GrpE [Sporomusa acidovorans]OZC22193.1 GrpE [Sporomusa acidovorans DSM 3132]SDE81824.1 Molecular chaperone GrpE (heat shock protein) [Sporomusa acidovorans]